MTEKRVKAWAVVDRKGEICTTIAKYTDGTPFAIYPHGRSRKPNERQGERVVPVTIVREEK